MKIQHIGKNSTRKFGADVAVALSRPKYARNVAGVIRAASCYGVPQVWMSGDRVRQDVEKSKRMPREERMKGYGAVDLFESDYFFDAFPSDVVPVAIEIMPSAEQLPTFEHPEKALYVFGPEDGSIPSAFLRHCHRFVMVPTAHCMNLAATVNVVLYDRKMKRQMAGLDPILPTDEYLNEDRGWADGGALHDLAESVELG